MGVLSAPPLGLGAAIAAHERAFGLIKAQHAAQIARRSRREFGHTGLAARNGFASPQKFLQSVTKVTAREAGQLVALGTAIGEAEATRELIDTGVTELGGEPVEAAWDEPICQAITNGTLSVDCADALRRGLGKPEGDITAEKLRALATELLSLYGDLPADALFQRARAERDLNDLDGIAARQKEQYLQGGFRLFRKANGMYGYAGQADPESAAVLMGALDPLTSPRLGGPRFVRPEDVARAQAIVDDPRTTERITLDGLAVRDGGCMWPDCVQPPAFTEAHHVEQWTRDSGRTDIDNGLLLCRFHHLLLHDHQWEVRRGADGRYRLTPPVTVDPDQVAILLESKNLLIRERQRQRGSKYEPNDDAVRPAVALLI
jgi:hypothetical protein